MVWIVIFNSIKLISNIIILIKLKQLYEKLIIKNNNLFLL